MSPRCSILLLQGRCKSCYAFAVVGALESMKALATKENKLTSLSEQNIIDCTGDQATYINVNFIGMQLCILHTSTDLCIQYDCSSLW